jgi:hypothetical protein
VVIREGLALREKNREWARQNGVPWSLAGNTQSMLGNSLIGQKRYAEAEPHLLQGYNTLKQITEQATGMMESGEIGALYPVKEALERLVQLYEAWEKPDQATKWRKELEKIKK